jgi:hypothetical protein
MAEPTIVKSLYDVLPGCAYEVHDERFEDPWVLGEVREVHVVTENYIVFTGANQRVVSLANYFVEGQNEFLGRLQRVQALPVPTLTEEEQAHFRSMLGYALAASLEEDTDSAESGLEAAREYATTQATKHARLEYLRGAAAVAALFLVVSAVGLILRGPLDGLPYDPITLTLFGLAGGALGGLLSVGRNRRGPGSFDPSASARDCLTAGGFRLVFAAVSAFLVVAAAHSGLVTSEFLRGKDPEQTVAAYLLVASAGGFLEKRARAVLELVGGVGGTESHTTPPVSGR